MGTERFWKIHWLVAVWHNVIGGLGVLFAGDWLYAREGLPAPEPGVNSVRWALLILVFALVYYMVYRDLYGSDRLVVVGICGKLASASSDLYYLAFQGGVPKIFWTTVVTDYIFVFTFLLFLGFVKKQRDSFMGAGVQRSAAVTP